MPYCLCSLRIDPFFALKTEEDLEEYGENIGAIAPKSRPTAGGHCSEEKGNTRE